MHRLDTDVLMCLCSNVLLEFGLLVYFVSAAGRH